MHGADGLHTTGSTRAPQPQHTKEAQDTVASRAPQRLIRSTRTSRRAQSHRVPLGRSTQTSRKLHAHAPAPCASRGTDPRARCRVPRCSARRAAPPREPGVRVARHRPGVVCRAGPGTQRSARAGRSGVRPAWCARMLPVPGACPACGTQSSRGNLQLAPVCILSLTNRMETGARYEYRSLISRISQPTFAKMARSPNFMAQ